MDSSLYLRQWKTESLSTVPIPLRKFAVLRFTMYYFFVLGAKDPEMQEIARVLDTQGVPYAYATLKGVPVRTSEAYCATGIKGLLPSDANIVFVECAVMGLQPDEICDHHNPGDPGFGKPPDKYFEGSSLGQVLKLLGLEATHEQRIIAAADHCLRHAYAGQCPGIDPRELAEWRERSRAALREITVEELRSRIDHAIEVLRHAPRIKIANEEVAWFPPTDDRPEEIAEASARIGIPFFSIKKERERSKCRIMSAAPQTIDVWMRECAANGLRDIYGDPARGFAGGYL